jgi:hypothetical protein
MDHDHSEDSFCSSEENENNEEQTKREILKPLPLTEKQGDIINLKGENIIKRIEQIGIESEKPIETDSVIITSKVYYTNLTDNSTKSIPILCDFPEETEINLSDNLLPRSFVLGITSMRKNEKATLFIKFKYIFKFLLQNKKIFQSKEELSILYDEQFQTQYENETIIFDVHLHNFYIIEFITDNGEIRKKILKQSDQNNHAKTSDIVTYHFKAVYNETELYNKTFIISELDKDFENNKLYEIEYKILQNIKEKEISAICVEPVYMEYKNKKFLNDYNLDNKLPTFFFCEILSINHFDYIYKTEKDKYSKTKILYPGIGRDIPDRDMSVKCKIQIKVDGNILFNSFECANIENDYITNALYTNQYTDWRKSINEEYNITNIDGEIDYNQDKIIYDKCSFKGLLDIDMKLYTIPNIFRKVLIHMKRNQINYIKTTHLDYFSADNCELYNLGVFGQCENQPNIEIYIHLYEFLHRPLFSKYNYNDKITQIEESKSIADNCFKNGKIYRAMKIYHNLTVRFDERDVFGDDTEQAEKYLKENQKLIYDKLIQLRLNIHNNYALCKFKLGNITSCYECTKKIIELYDNQNPKALYLYSKCCIIMKEYQKALDSLKILITIQKDNKDVMELYKEAQTKNNEDLGKNKNMFKKMFKAVD